MQCQKLKTYMETGRVIFLPTRSIRPSPMQPRTVFSQDALAELKLMNRAKCVLIQYLKMTEEQAHHYIEKQAMDLRCKKIQVAETILTMYE